MIEKLKQYKELITIILFFLGGFTWMETQFPTKTDLQAEIASLNCLVEKYMILTQCQMHGQDLEKQIQDINKQINMISPNGSSPGLSPALAVEFEELKSDLTHKKSELGQNKESMQKIVDELQRNVCRRGKT